MIQKMRKVVCVFRVAGIYGIWQLINFILRDLNRYLKFNKKRLSVVESSRYSNYQDAFLYRYATCDDLIMLKAKYSQYCFHELNSNLSNDWGLKQLGTLFCVEKIKQTSAKKILEVGTGYNLFFDKHFGFLHEYWMVDQEGFCSKKKFGDALNKRRSTKYVNSLLGSYSSELPDNYFDLIFSVSVLEHVSAEHRANVYKDMFRLLRPGGFIAHAIDTSGFVNNCEQYELIKKTGFIVTPRPDLTIRVHPGDGCATLFEPIGTVFMYYYGIDRDGMWDNLRSISKHTPTVLVFARKPLH